MKNNNIKTKFLRTLILMALISAGIFTRCSSSKKITTEPIVIETNSEATGLDIELEFIAGKQHNHPLMAIWIEDENGNYIESLYVAESIAKGIFGYGDNAEGFWQPGEQRRPAALPYWGHKRGYQAPDGLYLPTIYEPLPDAITGPTPQSDFVLNSKTSSTTLKNFKVVMEINQTWDWNDYWTNDKYPDDINYKTSCQPSLIYGADIDLNNLQETYSMIPLGHGHYSGLDGSLTSDLSTMTTALQISKEIIIRIE